MKNWFFLLASIAALFLSACQPKASACQWKTDTLRYLTELPTQDLSTLTPGPPPTPIEMKIGNRKILVDKVVEGPLCNDTWSGTVYVTCNVQVYQWEDQPTFLKDCNLTIEPGTVVYVAYHNDSAYYKGCSCHTGETAGP